MSAFARAIGALFRDRNMSASAVYRSGGDPLDPGLPVRVIKRAPDRFANFGEGRFVTESVMIDVQISEVAELAEGDTLEIAGTSYEVRGKPVRDSERLIWAAEARPL